MTNSRPNITLAVIQARKVCKVRIKPDHYMLIVPTDLHNTKSEPTGHHCRSYIEAIEWCTQAVARVALNIVKPDLDDKSRSEAYGKMRAHQLRNRPVTAAALVHVGCKSLEGATCASKTSA